MCGLRSRVSCLAKRHVRSSRSRTLSAMRTQARSHAPSVAGRACRRRSGAPNSVDRPPGWTLSRTDKTPVRNRLAAQFDEAGATVEALPHPESGAQANFPVGRAQGHADAADERRHVRHLHQGAAHRQAELLGDVPAFVPADVPQLRESRQEAVRPGVTVVPMTSSSARSTGSP